MAKTEDQQNDQQEQAPQPPLSILGQYTKDLSFEVPGAPTIYGKMLNNQPDVGVNVDVSAHPLQQNQFEVSITIRSECKIGGETGFVVELSYAGIFQLNVPQEHLEPMLLIECPRMLFPFARNIIADVTRDGSFPPLMLSPVDFAGMYRRRLEEVAAQKKDEAPAN